jgi:hypothetical protein
LQNHLQPLIIDTKANGILGAKEIRISYHTQQFSHFVHDQGMETLDGDFCVWDLTSMKTHYEQDPLIIHP